MKIPSYSLIPASNMTQTKEVALYESGFMPSNQIREFFQKLILSGEVWRMRGDYGDIARVLIKNRLCFGLIASNDNLITQQSFA